MSELLDWRYLRKEHRSQRRAFTCAIPPKPNAYLPGVGKRHPRPWELEAQSYLREQTPKAGDVVLGGFDGHGIAAMSFWDARDPTAVDIHAIGVANHWRHSGGAVARLLMHETLDRMAALALAGGARVTMTVNARIDRSNQPSQVLFTDLGFRNAGEVQGTPYESWIRFVELD